MVLELNDAQRPMSAEQFKEKTDALIAKLGGIQREVSDDEMRHLLKVLSLENFRGGPTREPIDLFRSPNVFQRPRTSKKGISSHQLHRALGITYKSAWFLTHRIREAMRSGGLLPPMGGAEKTVESDETFIGKNSCAPEGRKKPGVAFRNIVMTLVERGGSARSFHIDTHYLEEITRIARENVHRETMMNTDEGKWYNDLGKHFAGHETVNHSKDEYARGDVTTNTVEGYYSIFKRGMKGVYQHCAEKHLHRYLSEFDFRHSNRVALGIHDGERADLAIKGAAGKRLTYLQAN